MASVSNLEDKLRENEELILELDEILAIDPTSEETLAMRADCQATVSDLKKQIASHRGSASTSNPPPPPPPAPSSSTGNVPPPPPPPPTDIPAPPSDPSRPTFSTGDSVQARWSEDRQWYTATIISKTGSNADPIYTVKFASYGDKETKRAHEVRPLENKKRKAESAAAAVVPPPPPPPPPTTMTQTFANGSVISAAPSIDTTLIQKREPSKVSDGPQRMAPAPKKLKGNKALDKAKTSWNDWQKNGPRKGASGGPSKVTRESMFRTNDSVNARVGFTNSGKPMQKDQARNRWTYDRVDDEEEDG